MNLQNWQKEALQTLKEHDYNGVVKVASGKGKTILALKVIAEILEGQKEKKALVVVPTINLMKQWSKEIEKFYPEYSTSFYYGEQKSEIGQIVISVVNSAAKLEFTKTYTIKIFDEIHHYGAELYQSIFSIPTQHTIGLSATPEREDEGDLAIRYGAGKIVYSLSNIKELRERFSLWTVRVPFTMDEYQQYTDIQNEYYKLLHIAGIRSDQIQRLAKKGNKYALRILKLWSQQTTLRTNARNKLPVIKTILESEQTNKIIIFSESITFTETLHTHLPESIIVHSKLSKKEVLNRLAAFREQKTGILIAPRMIDEGYDVPNANVAIIASFTRSPRQMIQRDGRLLRGDDHVRRYTLLIEGIEEEKFFTILRKTGTTDVAFSGEWLRYNNGFIDDNRTKRHLKTFLTHSSQESFEDWLFKKLDLASAKQELDAEFYTLHHDSIERLFSEHPTRWPNLQKRTKQQTTTNIPHNYTLTEVSQLKEQLRKTRTKLFLPDELFNALMRYLDNEPFILDDDTTRGIMSITRHETCPPAWPEELFLMLKDFAGKIS